MCISNNNALQGLTIKGHDHEKTSNAQNLYSCRNRRQRHINTNPDRKSRHFAPIDSKKMVATALECLTTGGQGCSESILSAGCQALGIENDLVPDIALGLAGGIGLRGRICGLLTGSSMVVSLAVAKKEKDYAKKKMQSLQITGRLFDKFAQQFGSCRCRRLCGLDLTTPEGRKNSMRRSSSRSAPDTSVRPPNPWPRS